MKTDKTICPYQGPGQQNPAFIGGYDLIRPTDNPLSPKYWITSSETEVYDAGYNNGAGGTISFDNLLRISKGATGDCHSTVTLDIEVNPLVFSYYPPHSLDVIFVLDVTSSMMSNGSRKMALAKRALIQTINLLWQQNKDTVITIVPFARDAFVPLPGGGFGYNYLGTLFTWKRSTTSGHMIGQLLGYRNGSNVSTTNIPTYMTQSTPIATNAELSLYNFYNYYQIRYSNIYNSDGTAKTDTVLENYLANIYTANPSAYNGNFIQAIATGTPLTPAQLPYSMNDTGYENNTILDNMIWAIPYGEDTNTEAGLVQAHTLLKTPGFTQSEDILRRAVILITDGQANRSINPEYSDIYATPNSTDSDFLPDVASSPWKYFLYLKQTMASLIGEINNRSSNNEELVLALQRAYDVAQTIKDPIDGNASVFVLGIAIDAQQPGPYTKEDVLNIMRTIASTGSYLREAVEIGLPNPIIEELERLARYLLVLTGSLRLRITDTINTAVFDYVADSIRITGEQDGIKLKSLSAPDIIDPSDLDYTVYHKPALMPDVNDSNVQGGVITVDLGEIPFPLASPDSKTLVHITYEIKSKGSAYGNHLHTNNDKETYVIFEEPNHLNAELPDLSYDNAPRTLFFPTPIVACTPQFTIEKFVGNTAETTNYKSLDILACRQAYYRILVTNYTNEPLTFPLLYDVYGVNTVEEALVSPNRQILAENFTVPANGSENFTVPANGSESFSLQQKALCGEKTVQNFAIMEIESGFVYDNTIITIQKATASYTVKYLDYCTKCPIHCNIHIEGADVCTTICDCQHKICIPGWEYFCSETSNLELCNGQNVLKLYYVKKTCCKK